MSFSNIFQKKRQRGFTVIEILLVVSMVAMINLTLYTAFINGVKIWKRSQGFVKEENIAIFFDKFSEELRNAFPFSKIKFEGGRTSFTFPTIVKVPADPHSPMVHAGYVDQIGQVRYYFDSVRKTLYKEVANYGLATEEKFFEPRPVLKDVEYIEFRYELFRDGKFEWTGSLDTIPAWVEVEIRFLDDQGLRRQLERKILIPRGCWEDKDVF